MSRQGARSATDAAELRRAFDQAFANPAPPANDLVPFLAIRVAGQPFVLRVAELSRLEPTRTIVPLPGSTAGLLGLAGIQGRLTPVYSLAEALGLGAPPAGRWIAVYGRDEPVGLAFEAFEGFLRIPQADTLAGGAESMQQAVRWAGAVRPILSLASILAEVRKRAGMAEDVSKGP